MTVAAGIEIAGGGTLLPHQGNVPAGTLSVAATAQGALPSSVPEAESFRSGLQSLLASLNTNEDGLGDAQGESDGVGWSAGSAFGEVSGKATAASSTLSASASMRLVQASMEAKGEADDAGNLSMANAQRGAAAGRRADYVRSQASRTEEGKSATTHSSEPTDSARSNESSKSAQQDAALAVAIPGTIPAIATVPPVASAGVVPGIMAAETQSAQAVHSSDPSDGLASASIGSQSFGTDGQSSAAGAANMAGRGASGRVGIVERHGNASAAANLGNSSSPVSLQSQTLAAGEGEDTPANSMGGQTGHTLEAAGQGRASIAMLADGEGHASTLPGSQGSDPAAIPVLGQNEDLLSGTAGAVPSEVGQSSAALPGPGKPGSVGSSRSAISDTARMRGAGKLDLTQQGSHGVEGQVSASAVEVSAMGRDASGARGAMSSTIDAAKSTTGSESGARETFAALDAETAQGTPTWVHAGAQRAEAGFEDPALGWVGIRADLSGGGVHAAVVPGSADAAAALGSHLAGLNAYLAEHHTGVETVTMTAPEGGWAQSGQGTGQAMHQGTGHQSGQEATQGAEGGSQSSTAGSSTGLRTVSSELPLGSGEMSGSVQDARPGSAHISLIA
jgi:hypothetical protein